MADARRLSVDVNKIPIILQLRVVGGRTWRLRFWLGRLLLRLALKVMGWRGEVAIEDQGETA